MKRLVIDIETVGTPWEEHDPYVREYLIKGMNDAEAEEEKRRGALSPFTGHIVAIGVINVDDGRSCALFEVPAQSEVTVRKDGPRTYISGTEKQILEKFWEYLGRDDRFISFNGRQFDGPFLMIRSAVNGITPKRDLVGYRYSFHPNCDLREALNFWGSLNFRQSRFNLDLACKTFGIASSKSEGKDGRAVEAMYRAGRYEDIAVYCLEDVRATSELYQKLATTLLCWDTGFREAEAREERLRQARQMTIGEGTPLTIGEGAPAPFPSSEQSFIQSIEATSVELSASLERTEAPVTTPILTEKPQATILEKLFRSEGEDDQILIDDK